MSQDVIPSSPTSTEASNPVVISVHTGFDKTRLRNFYITNGFQGFVWMVFHFSVVFFFTFLLKNLVLVGIFLGFANFVSFLLDIPLGIIQRYASTKRLFIIAAFAQLIATGIFFAFIFKIFTIVQWVGGSITPDAMRAGTEWFFGSAINWVGIFVASICYGLAKELNDVSTFGYVLSHADPSEYGTILARNNITFGIGTLAGLVVSGVVLSFAPQFAVVVLGLIIIGFLTFANRYFDNSMDSITMQDVDNFKVSIQKWNKENVKEYLVDTVKKADIANVISGVKYLIIKPKQKVETSEKIPWKQVAIDSKQEVKIIWGILSHKPFYMSLLWTVSLVLIFGFWDTFATSFLIDFLDKVKEGWSYVLLAVIGVPGIVLQEQASDLAKKIGVRTVGIIGLGLSAFSLIAMGIFAMASTINPLIILGLALINSLGYACGMSMGQNQFLDSYNRIYADHENLTEINANASSGPMKLIQNFANVIGLVFGGILVGLGFPAFFIIFGVMIAGVLVWTIIEKDKIHL